MSGEVDGADTPEIMLFEIVLAPSASPAIAIPAAEKPTAFVLVMTSILFLEIVELKMPPDVAAVVVTF